MESFWSGKLTEEEKILRNKLISVLRESDLPCSASWQMLSELSDELGHAVKRSSELFTYFFEGCGEATPLKKGYP